MNQKYSLYNGEIELVFDDRPTKHIYYVNDKVVYGVTSIIGNVLAKPALLYWAVNQAIEYMENNLKPGEMLDEVQIKTLLENARTAHRNKSAKAADIGKIGHKWLEDYVKARIEKKEIPKRPVNKELKKGIDGFFQWAKDYKVALIASEQKVYSREYEFAGTYDLEAMVNSKRAMNDFKFSNAIYDEYVLQASAYLKAKEEETGIIYDGGINILRLSKNINDSNPFEVRCITRQEVDRYFKAFLCCLEIYRWQMENKRLEILARNL